MLLSRLSNVEGGSKKRSAYTVEGKIIYSAIALFAPHGGMRKGPSAAMQVAVSLFLNISQKKFSVPVLINVKGVTKYIEGLIDSGAVSITS